MILSEEKFDELFCLAPDTIRPFIHKGKWAIHDVLPILLSRYGPADVTICTFSIAEDSLRALFLACDKGDISNLTLLLDHSVRKNKIELLLFAENFSSEIFLDNVHAKIFLFSGDINFGIVGSANLNTNRRIESGFYFTDKDIFNYFQSELNAYITDAVKYELE